MTNIKDEIKQRFEQQTDLCSKVMTLLSLMANKSRFRILCMLYEKDFCVSEIVDVVGDGKISHISQQLKALTLAGILEKRRVDRNVIYHLADDNVRALIRFLTELYLKKV